MRSRRRIEALAIGYVAIDNAGIRHYAALALPSLKLRACDERAAQSTERYDGDPNITCLLCASKELP